MWMRHVHGHYSSSETELYSFILRRIKVNVESVIDITFSTWNHEALGMSAKEYKGTVETSKGSIALTLHIRANMGASEIPYFI